MKQKLSISMGKKTVKSVDLQIKSGVFRSRSHLIEYAVKELLKK